MSIVQQKKHIGVIINCLTNAYKVLISLNKKILMRKLSFSHKKNWFLGEIFVNFKWETIFPKSKYHQKNHDVFIPHTVTSDSIVCFMHEKCSKEKFEVILKTFFHKKIQVLLCVGAKILNFQAPWAPGDLLEGPPTPPENFEKNAKI